MTPLKRIMVLGPPKRMDETRCSKTVWQGTPEDTRKCGMPRQSWTIEVQEAIEARKLILKAYGFSIPQDKSYFNYV